MQRLYGVYIMPTDRIVTTGVVLRVTQTKEADDILTVLTAEHGKLGVIARGARRKNSKLAAASQLFAFSELVLYERRGWYLLSEASTIALFDGLRADLARLSLAAYFAEMTEAVTSEELPSGEILSLLLNALYALDTLDTLGRPLWQVRAAFELKLLALSGYEPLLTDCAVCAKREPEEPVFDVQQGIVLCRRCAGGARGIVLDAPALAAMRYILCAPPKKMLSFALEGASRSKLTAACEAFVQAQLERRFQTLEFYRSLEATQG